MQDKSLLKQGWTLQVDKIEGDDVYCTANNHANLDGLVTIFHTERSSDTLNNVQNDLPIMTEDDKSNIKDLSVEFEVDFISLSFTRSGEDIQSAREFLDSTWQLPRYCCISLVRACLCLLQDKTKTLSKGDVGCTSYCQDASEDEKCDKMLSVCQGPKYRLCKQ